MCNTLFKLDPITGWKFCCRDLYYFWNVHDQMIETLPFYAMVTAVMSWDVEQKCACHDHRADGSFSYKHHMYTVKRTKLNYFIS